MAHLKTQGTELFVLIPGSGSTATVLKMGCPNSLTGIGSGAKSKIDVTCLSDTTDRKYEAGLGEPGSINVPFIFNGDGQEHKALTKLKNDGTVTSWNIAFSDGTNPATTAGGSLVAPTERSSISFKGFVAELTLDFTENEVIRGTLTIERSGSETFTYKD